MKLRIAVTASLFVLYHLSAISPAQAKINFCSEPRAPSVGFIIQPRKPYCATSGDGCPQWEIDSYKRQVRSYIDSLQSYLADVDKYRKNAYEYATCMADLE